MSDQPGTKASSAALAKYEKKRQEDFIKRAGAFTEDLVAYIIDERKRRDLSDHETIFALALANINLRNDYGNPPPTTEASRKDAKKTELLNEFDEFCYQAQQYWDSNA